MRTYESLAEVLALMSTADFELVGYLWCPSAQRNKWFFTTNTANRRYPEGSRFTPVFVPREHPAVLTSEVVESDS